MDIKKYEKVYGNILTNYGNGIRINLLKYI